MAVNCESRIQHLKPKSGDTSTFGSVKQVRDYARRLAFSQFVDGLQTNGETSHLCCGEEYSGTQYLYRHINSVHFSEITSVANHILLEGSEEAKWKVLRKKQTDCSDNQTRDSTLPHAFCNSDEFPWLPLVTDGDSVSTSTKGQVLLFYKYRHIKDTYHVKEWQEVLCKRLKLTGKVRVAHEGLNGTVAGTVVATEIYMTAVMKHPLFSDMTLEQFKTSDGHIDAFPDGLRVSIHEEAVPMGIKPEDVPYENAGVHLSPEEFHQAMSELQTREGQSSSVLIDCRNYYESKIGQFDGAIAPDIRKFSYWPEYVDGNAELFRDKDVYMYCTGGIRCERGSAYLKAQGLCREVYQLEGGIHRYAEKYPNGFFQGKLFVFDNRYAIPVNDVVLSECIYCGQPWDKYEPCSSTHCYQLVLSCPDCRSQQRTACCTSCQQNHELNKSQEECACTRRRERVTEEPRGRKPENQGQDTNCA